MERTTDTTALVTWDTPTTAAPLSFSNYVEYRVVPPTGPPPPWTPTPEFQDTTTRHTVTITVPTANQKYQVRSRTKDLTLPGAPETISEEWLTFTTAANANQTIYAFSPTDDAFVDLPPPPPTCYFFGNSIFLGLHVPSNQIYLKFNVNGVAGTPGVVKLRLFTLISGSHGGNLHSVSDVGWSEGTDFCPTPPVLGPTISSVAVFINSEVTYEFTGLPYQSGPVSYGIKLPPEQTYALGGYASKESGISPSRGYYPPPTLYVTATNP